MTTMDYVVVMIGLFFIVESLGDAFKSRRCDCEDKIAEIEGRLKKLEELNNQYLKDTQ